MICFLSHAIYPDFVAQIFRIFRILLVTEHLRTESVTGFRPGLVMECNSYLCTWLSVLCTIIAQLELRSSFLSIGSSVIIRRILDAFWKKYLSKSYFECQNIHLETCFPYKTFFAGVYIAPKTNKLYIGYSTIGRYCGEAIGYISGESYRNKTRYENWTSCNAVVNQFGLFPVCSYFA